MSYRKKHIKTKINKIKNPKKIFINKPVFWLAVFFVVIVFFAFYVFIFSEKFQIKNIVISGNKKVENANIQNFVSEHISRKILSVNAWNIYSKSFFLVNIKKLSKDILNNFPEIENAKITKNIPETVTIEIIERRAFGAFCEAAVLHGVDNGLPLAGEECFSIDKNGIVFYQLSEIPGGTIVMRNPLDTKQAFVGERVIAENIMEAILKIEKNLKENFQINVKEATVSSPIRLNVKTNENWEIYFNLESNIDTQIAKIVLLLNEEITTNVRKKLQYIDLRFKDNAYYK